MDITPAIQITSMLKAMTDVVFPAVDPQNKMAQEQAGLVIATLKFLQRRLPIMYRFNRDELERYVALSRELVFIKGGEKTGAALNAISKSSKHGADLLAAVGSDPGDMEAAVLDLKAKVCQLIKAVDEDGEAASKKDLRRLILDSSKIQSQRDRAFTVLMGFEVNPSSIPLIEDQLNFKPLDNM